MPIRHSIDVDDDEMNTLKVLALSGSLRKASLNTAMLTMAIASAPTGVRVQLYRGLGGLPLFNPDLELSFPDEAAHLRDEIAGADVLLIASPEYAHGVSGVMKNALDWMVSSAVFVDKPVALWNASPRASIALAALRETLKTMSARVVDAASLELLILSTIPTEPPANPDPVAMHDALRVLRSALHQEAPVSQLAVCRALGRVRPGASQG